jgi:transcriptional regulator with XRE-family HTH domain
VDKSIYSEKQQTLQLLLRQIRIEAGFSQAVLAERLHEPQSFVSKYESGQRRLDLIELQQVCRALGVSLVSFADRFEKASHET